MAREPADVPLMAVGSLRSFKRPGRLLIAQNSCQLAGGKVQLIKNTDSRFRGDFDRESAHRFHDERQRTHGWTEPSTTGRRIHDDRVHRAISAISCAMPTRSRDMIRGAFPIAGAHLRRGQATRAYPSLERAPVRPPPKSRRAVRLLMRPIRDQRGPITASTTLVAASPSRMTSGPSSMNQYHRTRHSPQRPRSNAENFPVVCLCALGALSGASVFCRY